MSQGPDHTSRPCPHSVVFTRASTPNSALVLVPGGVGGGKARRPSNPPLSHVAKRRTPRNGQDPQRPSPEQRRVGGSPSPRDAADPPYWVQVTGPSPMGGGPDHTTWRGPTLRHDPTLRTPAVAQATERSTGNPPCCLPRTGEARCSSPVLSRGALPTLDAALKFLSAAPGTPRPRRECHKSAGPCRPRARSPGERNVLRMEDRKGIKQFF
ncbi:hypothetical protein NDU88_011726 [Pleurodeles waltl]|uniref:Uncharacterized protein n=1 Tax=Pleurodeles waltl TaxID=8319 RepID=A0AAV7S538_PLEWA|nr:hypothetical protein NDU88_011726 [Pleurodeles waltl]